MNNHSDWQFYQSFLDHPLYDYLIYQSKALEVRNIPPTVHLVLRVRLALLIQFLFLLLHPTHSLINK